MAESMFRMLSCPFLLDIMFISVGGCLMKEHTQKKVKRGRKAENLYFYWPNTVIS